MLETKVVTIKHRRELPCVELLQIGARLQVQKLPYSIATIVMRTMLIQAHASMLRFNMVVSLSLIFQ